MKLKVIALAALLLGCKVKISKGEQTDVACNDSAQCPAADEPCLLSQCLDGECVYIPAPQGPLPPEDQRAGDCKEIYCDGNGEVFTQPASADMPRDDKNPCTEAICDVDRPRQAAKPAGASCVKGVCNAAGRCGECLPGAQRCTQGPQLCTAEGHWTAPKPCDAAHPKCDAGKCIALADIEAGADHACALFEDGTARCWGKLDRAALANPSDESLIVWSSDAMVDFGPRHACMVQGGQVSCWGAGDFGQLGNGTYEAADTPVENKLAAAVQVAVGDNHSCARTAEGDVFCWGRNDRGQLGGSRGPAIAVEGAVASGGGALLTPTPLPGGGLAALSLDAGHSCARTRDGGGRCWGLAPFAESAAPTGADLQRIKRSSRAEPTKVAGLTGVAQVACGAAHSCALLGDGSVRCWGAGDRGQLGDKQTSDNAKPVAVAGLAGATRIELGRDFGCALVEGTRLFCWGANDRGQLGRGAGSATGEAQAVPLTGTVRDFAVGDAFACALTDGLSCWGAGQAGQLGNGKAADARSPSRVAW